MKTSLNLLEKNVRFQGSQSPLEGFLVENANAEKSPGVLVIHEVYGLTDHMRQISRQLGRAGYTALAVDLFAGKNKAFCIARFMAAIAVGSTEHEGIQDLRLAVSFLSAAKSVDAQRLGAIGFCMGGGFAIALACKDRRLKAIAPFYGNNPRPISQLARICPLVGSYPEKDLVTVGAAKKLETTLTQFQIPHDIKIYPNAKHAFMNPQGRNYDASAAKDAWQRTLDFFENHI